MSNGFLIHDVAWKISIEIVEIFAGLLREEEKRDAFEEVYAQVKAGLERFQVRHQRMQRRMRPGTSRTEDVPKAPQ